MSEQTQWFFKKTDPKTAVLMPNGHWIAFIRVDVTTGIFHTKERSVAEGFRQLAAQHQGGVDEITQEEFHELLKKKEQQSSTRVWREEWQPQAHLNAKVPMEGSQGAGAAAAAVASSFHKAVSPPALPQTVERPKATKRD